MASREIALLEPTLRRAVPRVKSLCRQQGFEVLVYCTLRDFYEQSRLYRRSRQTSQVQWKINQLETKGFEELAEILDAVGPQKGVLGEHVTMAGPGESWHQYGHAFDAVPMVGGKPQWEVTAPEWRIYGNAARMAGVYWAGDWIRFTEYPHVQSIPGGNPLQTLDRDYIKQAAKECINEQP